jgi:Calcineurin-like phosphoesterase
MGLAVRVLLLIATIAAWSATSAAAQDARWVQCVPGGIEARAITDKAQCPPATLDGAAVPMMTRSAPGSGFPVRVCALAIPRGAKVVTVDDIPMPLPVARPNRILLIGDTGCRLKDSFVQACNDSVLWPFQVGADVASTLQPDLVIHVGDFYYRETACPPGDLGCAGSPFGDTWASWRADFFTPARLLLATAPWVLVRGNHEECTRGGIGWERTLDPFPYDKKAGSDGCLKTAAPFVADIGGISVVVMDTASARENSVDEKEAALYRQQFKSIATLAPSGIVWLAFHRVIWSTDGTEVPGKSGGDNKTLAAAATGNIPANVQLMLTGHQHKFEVDAYVEDIPVTIVSGHGGDLLSPDAPTNPVGLVVNGMHIKAGFAKPRTFGFSMLERTPEAAPDRWTITDYGTHGQLFGRCAIQGRSVDCGN